MESISIDLETFSDVDIKEAGTYKYTESECFDIMLFGYSIDNGPVEVIDLSIETLPVEIVKAITDPAVTKYAFNAAFERRCLSVYLKTFLPAEQWVCTMIKSAMVGLPFKLDQVAKALKLDQGKISEGKALIRYFGTPCKPTAKNGGRVRNRPWDAPDKWARFIEYCKHDVELERTIANKIKFLQIPERERRLWVLDQKINDRGVKLDLKLINQVIKIDTINNLRLAQEMTNLTGVDNPNSGAQLRGFFGVKSLTKQAVKDQLEEEDPESDRARALEVRQELAKTSNKKWPGMLDGVQLDGRIRGILQFYGAGRTGRWAGRRLQPQNLPGIKLKSGCLDLARNLALAGDIGGIEFLYGNISDTLSQLIRTAIIPAPGHVLRVCDLSSIEARITAWLAGEKWVLEVFRTHGKIYEAAAANMLKIPIEEVTKEQRQKGKIGTLALGYQGGVNALVTMGALQMGIAEEDLPGIVYGWRRINPMTVKLWYDVNDAAIIAVRDNVKTRTSKGITFHVEKGVLFVTLPNGRRLAYLRPKIGPGKFGNDQLSYEGLHQKTRQWVRLDTYGGKLVENIVQAIARDILAEGMLNVDDRGYNLILTVHDELVTEDPIGVGSIEEIEKLMTRVPSWAPGLPLGAEGFESQYYKK